MRPSSSNKRLRGRTRKGPNPLTRSFESNGPDVKIRGTAMHIAEKYVQLARDAQVSGDGVMAENYFQHAEHYFRMIAAAQPQQTGPGQMAYGRDDEGDEEYEGRGEFNNRPEPYGQPQHQPQPQPHRGNGTPYQGHDQGGHRGYEQRDNRGYEGRGNDQRGNEQRGNDQRSDQRGGEPRSYEGRNDEGRYGDQRPREPRPPYEGQRSQHEPRHGGEQRRYDRAPAPQNGGVNGHAPAAPAPAAAPLPGLGPQPDLEPPVAVQPAVQPAAAAPAAPEPVMAEADAGAPVAATEEGAPRPRRRSRGSRGRGRRADGTGGEEGDGAPALPFAEDGATEG